MKMNVLFAIAVLLASTIPGDAKIKFKTGSHAQAPSPLDIYTREAAQQATSSRPLRARSGRLSRSSPISAAISKPAR